jgi:Flp pilus assembly protein TadD
MGPAPSKSAEEETDAAPKPVTTSKADAEPPQLSRTDADRLSTTGQASPAAKAIDVDYQMIERSLARGDHQTALESAGKLEKYIGENWRTRYLTGVALMGLNRWEPAIVALSKAQDLNPSHAMSALYLSVALQERGEHTRAIQVLDKALVSLPQSSELWLNLGHSHEALGHKAEAKTAYNRFLDLSGNRQDLAGQRVWVQNRLQKDK